MNYYILTNTKYNSIDKGSIQDRLKSIDESRVLVVTTEDISGYTTKFSDAEECSQYTYDNHSDWTGDGIGVDTFDLTDGQHYIPEIDD